MKFGNLTYEVRKDLCIKFNIGLLPRGLQQRCVQQSSKARFCSCHTVPRALLDPGGGQPWKLPWRGKPGTWAGPTLVGATLAGASLFSRLCFWHGLPVRLTHTHTHTHTHFMHAKLHLTLRALGLRYIQSSSQGPLPSSGTFALSGTSMVDSLRGFRVLG